MSQHWVAFYRGHGRMSDIVVRWATRSSYSHCELIRQPQRPRHGDTVTCLSASGRDGGVRIKDVTLERPKWSIYAVPWAPQDTWDRAAEKVGEPYDLLSMFTSQLFNFRRNARGKWYCSELIAHGLGLSMPHAMSPGDLLRTIQDHATTWQRAQDTLRASGDGAVLGADGVDLAPPLARLDASRAIDGPR